MDTIFYAIADLFGLLFDFLPKLGNIPNTIIIISGFIAFVIWVSLMVKFKKEDVNE